MKVLIALLITAILSGCGARGFAKQGASYQEFYQDLQFCTGKTFTPYTTAGLSAAPVVIQQHGDVNVAATNQTAHANLMAASLIYQVNHNRGNRNNCMKYLNWEIRRGDDVFHP